MNPTQTNISLQEIRDLDLVNYLASLGHEPRKIRGNDFWYLSPLRNERVPSFKVNRKINRWYDFGLGQGGNLIDFAIRYQGCSVGDFCSTFALRNKTETIGLMRRTLACNPDNKIEIKEIVSLRSDGLLTYLRERRISIRMADFYCKEVRYRVGNTTFFQYWLPESLRRV